MDALIFEPKSHIDTIPLRFPPSTRTEGGICLHGLTLGKYCRFSTTLTLEIFAKHINCSHEKFVGNVFVNILYSLFDFFFYFTCYSSLTSLTFSLDYIFLTSFILLEYTFSS